LFLHALHLEMNPPTTEAVMKFQAPVPSFWNEILVLFRSD